MGPTATVNMCAKAQSLISVMDYSHSEGSRIHSEGKYPVTLQLFVLGVCVCARVPAYT